MSVTLERARGSRAEGTSRARRATRASAVALTVVTAAAVWLIADLAGADVKSPAFPGSASAQIGLPTVVAAALAAALGGWGVLAVLEHLIERARLVWTVVAIAVLLVSLAAPFSGTGISTGNRLILALLHVAVGSVLIPLLTTTGGHASEKH